MYFLIRAVLANNEVGSIQPVAEIAQRIEGSGILLHTDASQAVGKIPVDFQKLGVDLLTIAGHKVGLNLVQNHLKKNPSVLFIVN